MDSPEDEIRKRRARLAALRNTRAASNDAGSAQKPEAPEAEPLSGGDSMKLKELFQGGGKQDRQRKLLMSAMNVLTQTPEGGKGYVPDTPFTEAGVQRLVTMLRERSHDETKPGAKVAKGVLKFLEPGEGEAVCASGVSIVKLQSLARRVESVRNNGRGRAARGF